MDGFRGDGFYGALVPQSNQPLDDAVLVVCPDLPAPLTGIGRGASFAGARLYFDLGLGPVDVVVVIFFPSGVVRPG